jgi:hypothetical protein
MRQRTFFEYAAVATCVVTMTAGVMAQTPAGTAFSYQGRLTDNGVAANGPYDLRFTLFETAAAGSAIGAPVVADDVIVSGGVFTVMLDFGAAFEGHARWLEIGVRPGASSGAFTTLGARQPITPAPHALFSQASQTSARSTSSAASDSTPWSGLTSVPAGFADGVDNDALGGLTCAPTQIPKWTGAAWACAADSDNSATQWHLTGNAGTGGSAFLGTIDAQPFEIRVNNIRALRILPASDPFYSPSILAGHDSNDGPSTGVTIAGGGNYLDPNIAISNYAVISGGIGNTAGLVATVGGGANNQATGEESTISGGLRNTASAEFATVSGGLNNRATARYAMVAGGQGNLASAINSFAAGSYAQATDDGSFVWADQGDFATAVSSNGTNRFVVVASGGMWFGTRAFGSPPGSFSGFLNTSTGAYLSNAGIWTNASDRHLKEHFAPVDGRALLDTLARLPVTRWNYKTEPGVQHIGPTAQDFQAAFGFGGDDKTITTLDPAGIALRAIQQLDRENHELREEINALKAIVAQLQQTPRRRSR